MHVLIPCIYKNNIMIKLSEISTKAPEGFKKQDIKKKTEKIAERIGDLLEMMKAGKKHSILIVFQGMDSSGKDGASRKVFKFCSPTSVHAYGFKKPTDKEFAHDFLWRVHKQVPAKGEIKIFNRSHYEDVLIQRVHKWIDEDKVTKRIAAINAFEELLVMDNNTTILKFYMHLSKERQLEKLQERVDVERKKWKHSDGDWEQREHWDEYMRCYEDVINRSSIPWHIAPVDDRFYRDYFIASKVLETLEGFNMEWPALESERFKE